MKMLALGFIAVMGVSSAAHVGPVLPKLCPPGYTATEAYVNGKFVGWKCVPKVKVPSTPAPSQPE